MCTLPLPEEGTGSLAKIKCASTPISCLGGERQGKRHTRKETRYSRDPVLQSPTKLTKATKGKAQDLEPEIYIFKPSKRNFPQDHQFCKAGLTNSVSCESDIPDGLMQFSKAAHAVSPLHGLEVFDMPGREEDSRREMGANAEGHPFSQSPWLHCHFTSSQPQPTINKGQRPASIHAPSCPFIYKYSRNMEEKKNKQTQIHRHIWEDGYL